MPMMVVWKLQLQILPAVIPLNRPNMQATSNNLGSCMLPESGCWAKAIGWKFLTSTFFLFAGAVLLFEMPGHVLSYIAACWYA